MGQAAPFGFTHFEVGNEVYFANGRRPPVQAAPYVAFAGQFAAAARLIDPSASIGVDVSSPGNPQDTWNTRLLAACAKSGFTPGFLSDHFYVFDSADEAALSDAALLTKTTSDPTSVDPADNVLRNWAGRSEAFRKLLDDNLPATGAGVELLAAEFNSDAASGPRLGTGKSRLPDGSPRFQGTKQSTSLVHGLFIADAIGGALQDRLSGCRLLGIAQLLS